MVDDSDAMKRRKKKRIDHIVLPGNWLKMFGNTSKTNAGPCVGDTPNVNTAGKIITPDKIATVVSRHAVIVALFTMWVSLLK